MKASFIVTKEVAHLFKVSKNGCQRWLTLWGNVSKDLKNRCALCFLGTSERVFTPQSHKCAEKYILFLRVRFFLLHRKKKQFWKILSSWKDSYCFLRSNGHSMQNFDEYRWWKWERWEKTNWWTDVSSGCTNNLYRITQKILQKHKQYMNVRQV